jgi:5-methylcytosine-specific restriction endonuclease McrA
MRPTHWSIREELYETDAELHRRPPPRPAEVLASMPYPAYLRTPEWRTRSRQRKNLACYRCEWCGSTRDLNTHHLNYQRRGFEDIDEDLICLCRRCHEQAHDL